MNEVVVNHVGIELLVAVTLTVSSKLGILFERFLGKSSVKVCWVNNKT